MTAPHKRTMHITSFRRNTSRPGDRPHHGTGLSARQEFAGRDTRNGEIVWALELLRTTRIRVSLFRLVFPGLSPDAAARALAWTKDMQGLTEALPDGSIALLVVGGDKDDHDMAGRIAAQVRQSLSGLGGRAIGAPFGIAELHRHADEIGDAEDALLLLLTMPPRMVAPGSPGTLAGGACRPAA